jgi:hypothetical protein
MKGKEKSCKTCTNEKCETNKNIIYSVPHFGFGGSVFLSHIFHAYAQTDGSYKWPNSREGDMLRRAKLEIETLLSQKGK